MQFFLLGSLLVRRGGVAVPVATKKQRALLAALLLNGNRLVTLDELAETLWGSKPPPSARVTLQNYVKRLRQTLADEDRVRISTQPGGYLMRVHASELDVTEFGALLDAARELAAAGFWDQAAARLRTALALWRGEPLADVPSEVLEQREAPRLREMRLQALEARIDADLHLGRHAQVIAELRQLTWVHPLREGLYGLRMLALYRDGRQGEALATYRQARRLLIDEIGAEPGAQLQELHQRVLNADPALAAPGGSRAVATPAQPVVPRQLPAAARRFTGRSGELHALAALLDEACADAADDAPVIAVIGGTAGVGKTALAVHWAHQITTRFPDGQLYVNLGGYQPGVPVEASDALAAFLRTLGVPGACIPAQLAERAALYRSLLAGRRVLVMLDNAGSERQVRPLLPGGPGCLTLVTSRDTLPGLVARDGARRLDLAPLPVPDAVGLLRKLIGRQADADPAAATALAGQCAQLPLALRVAAELASARPAVPLTSLVAELADQQRRLDLLEAGGDGDTGVRAVLSWSYRQLAPAPARAFRLFGLHPGPDLDRYAAAALTGSPVGEADQLLARLSRAHLVHGAGPGRYGLHDLLRMYAQELTTSQDSVAERTAALTRLFDCYLRGAANALDTLFPADRHRRPAVPQSGIATPPMSSACDAQRWLDDERANLVAIAVHGAAHEWPGQAGLLAAILPRYLDLCGHYQDGVMVSTLALRAARLTGDRAGQAAALEALGGDAWRLGQQDEAAQHLKEALTIFRDLDDRPGQGRAFSSLGTVESARGRPATAARHHRFALLMFRRAGDRLGQARALDSLGIDLCHLGHYRQAAGYQHAALAIYRELGERHGEAGILVNIGVVEWWQSRYPAATGHLREALAVSAAVGDRRGQALALSNLGVVARWQGQHRQAAGHYAQAAALLRALGDESGAAEAGAAHCEALQAAGSADRAELAPRGPDQAGRDPGQLAPAGSTA